MSRYNKNNNRDQLSILPMCLDDMLPKDAEVRALEAIVDKMDIHSMGFVYSQTSSTGRPPYDPSDMFKIYIYSYFNGIRSSRKIERECHRNIELMWLIGDIRPDFKTIADFRRFNKEPIKSAFKRFGMICAELGLIGKATVAIDGSKFRASNSRLKYHSEKKIEEKIQHFTDKVEHYVNLLDICDKDDNDKPELSSSEATFSNSEITKRIEIIEKIDKINNRLEELHLLKEQVKQNGTIYKTDPDARMMKVNGSAIDICHNVQIAVDSKNHMVVAVDVTSQAIDKEQLYNVASQAKENLEVDTLTALADKGYYSALQFALCESNGISPIVSKATRSFIAATKGYAKEAFSYDEGKSGYFCPQGHFLKAYPMSTTSKSAGFIVYENRQACRNCNARHLCTKGEYRKITDKPFEEHARSVDKRTSENEGAYKMRQQLAEHPWGAIKRSWGFSYFLTRRTENVRTESLLHFLVYNMKRAVNIMGVQGLREAL